jgi:hypothetical protein
MKMRVEPQHRRLGWLAGRTTPSPSAVPAAAYASDPGVKPPRKLREQAAFRYEGELCHFLDAARLTLVFDSCEKLLEGLDQASTHACKVPEWREHQHLINGQIKTTHGKTHTCRAL